MKTTSENRYTQPLQEWKESQQRLTAIFSTSILKSKAFEKEELAFRQDLLMRIGRPNNLEERITQKLLQQEKRELEKKLIPNPVIRIVLRAAEYSRQQFQGYLASSQKNASLIESQPAFRPGQELNRLASARSKKIEESAPSVKQNFIGQAKFFENEQKNLLEGRSVEKKGKWFFLDLSDMDTRGRFALKEIPFKFDLDAKLQKLPFKVDSQVIERLRQGERVEIKIGTASDGKTISLEANPIMRTLNFYDQQQRKVTLKQISGLQDPPTLSIGRQKKVGISIG